MAQSASLRFPPAAPGIRYQVISCGICGGQSGAEADILRVLGLRSPILISPIAAYSFIIAPSTLQNLGTDDGVT
jgi:hypothetical protein